MNHTGDTRPAPLSMNELTKFKISPNSNVTGSAKTLHVRVQFLTHFTIQNAITFT